jgi:hypothetical protein
MKKVNPDDQKFTELIKSHRFENEFILKQSETESQEVKLLLFEKTLTFYSKDDLLLSVVIDQNFKIIEDNLSTYSLRISFDLNNDHYE